METLRSFIQTMWSENTDIHADHPNADKHFISPDDYLENFDLRRVTTAKNKYGVQTVLYEYYWAHLMQGNKLVHIFKWLKRILFSNPFRLPRPLNVASLLLLIILVGIGALIFWFNNVETTSSVLSFIKKIVPFTIPVFVSWIIYILEKYVGDAARYLDPSPPNVHVRETIRKQGVQLIEKLRKKGYEKIILVGHSLGSVIAYDIIRYAWSTSDLSFPSRTRLPELNKIVDHINKTSVCQDIAEYQERQWSAFQEHREKGGDWLVSDLVTIGSPLTYSQILLAKNLVQFDMLKDNREIHTSPPELDNRKLTYTSKSQKKRKMINSSAFALTRWNNIYSSTMLLVLGDIISGPIKHLFGDMIDEIDINENEKRRLFDHTKYWKKGTNSKKGETPKTPMKIETLRDSLKLDELKSKDYLDS